MGYELRSVTHINAMVAEAHQRANAIHRAFVSRDTSLLVRAFLVYVRPLVEYNSIILSPHLKQDIEASFIVRMLYKGITCISPLLKSPPTK